MFVRLCRIANDICFGSVHCTLHCEPTAISRQRLIIKADDLTYILTYLCRSLHTHELVSLLSRSSSVDTVDCLNVEPVLSRGIVDLVSLALNDSAIDSRTGPTSSVAHSLARHKFFVGLLTRCCW